MSYYFYYPTSRIVVSSRFRSSCVGNLSLDRHATLKSERAVLANGSGPLGKLANESPTNIFSSSAESSSIITLTSELAANIYTSNKNVL